MTIIPSESSIPYCKCYMLHAKCRTQNAAWAGEAGSDDASGYPTSTPKVNNYLPHKS